MVTPLLITYHYPLQKCMTRSTVCCICTTNINIQCSFCMCVCVCVLQEWLGTCLLWHQRCSKNAGTLLTLIFSTTDGEQTVRCLSSRIAFSTDEVFCRLLKLDACPGLCISTIHCLPTTTVCDPHAVHHTANISICISPDWHPSSRNWMRFCLDEFTTW
jgi:hypothetical protein